MTTDANTTSPVGFDRDGHWTALFCAILVSEQGYNLFRLRRASSDTRQRRLAIYYRAQSVVKFDRVLVTDSARRIAAMRTTLTKLAA